MQEPADELRRSQQKPEFQSIVQRATSTRKWHNEEDCHTSHRSRPPVSRYIACRVWSRSLQLSLLIFVSMHHRNLHKECCIRGSRSRSSLAQPTENERPFGPNTVPHRLLDRRSRISSGEARLQAREYRKERRGNYRDASRLNMHPIVLLFALTIIGDLSSFIAEKGSEKASTGLCIFFPAALAQNFTCPEHAEVVETWRGRAGVGDPVPLCRCKSNFFNSTLKLFQDLLIQQLGRSIGACTPTFQCPCKWPLLASVTMSAIFHCVTLRVAEKCCVKNDASICCMYVSMMRIYFESSWLFLP